MTVLSVFSHRLPPRGIRHRMELRAGLRDLSPHMLRDIGLEPEPDCPRIPPFAALMMRD